MKNGIMHTAAAPWKRLGPYLPAALMVGLVVGLTGFSFAAGFNDVLHVIDVAKTWIVRLVAAGAVVVILISGAQMVLAGATSPKAYDDAKKRLLYAVIGLVVTGFANFIVNFFIDFVDQSGGNLVYCEEYNNKGECLEWCTDANGNEICDEEEQRTSN